VTLSGNVSLKAMTPELNERWLASRPPFDGTTVAIRNDPTPYDLLDMLRFVGESLRKRYPLILRFDDWHEHDGFITKAILTDWRTLESAWANLDDLIASRPGDDYVRIAIFPANFDWLLRYDLDPGDSTAVENAWPYCDFTASTMSEAAKVVDSIKALGLGHTVVTPAATFFNSCYAG
jgi:hypothetical protein